MSRRLALMLCLALVAIAAAGVSFSNASFTTASSVTVQATSSPTTMDTLAIDAGNGQSASVGAAVAVDPSVRVTDKNGNPVSGLAVTFSVESGGGSATGVDAVTNGSGIATVASWTLGTAAGANTLTASAAGLVGSPVTFTATGVAGTASKYVVTPSSYSPVAGSAVSVSAQVTDQYGNPVASSGRSVTWSKTGTGGTFSANPTLTNASGIATVDFTTSITVRTHTVRATSTGLTGTSSNIVTVAGPATKIAINAGNNQTTTAGTAVATLPRVKVTDVNNNAVAGVAVTFVVASGGGSATGVDAITNAAGVATVGSWTLGTTAGANTLRVTKAGLTGSPITFTATAKADVAVRYLVTSSVYNPVAGGTVVITAQQADQYGNPVTGSGIVVTWSKTGTGGSFASGTSVTASNGRATVVFTVSSTVGIVHTVTATTGANVGTSPDITTR